MARLFALILGLAIVVVIAVAVGRSLHSSAPTAAPTAPAVSGPAVSAPATPAGPVEPAPAASATFAPPPTPARSSETFAPPMPSPCQGSATFAEAARLNAQSAVNLTWAPFGRDEIGWVTYAPLIAEEIGSGCDPASASFAQALADWQAAHHFRVDGVMTAAIFDTMKAGWQGRRPYVALRGKGICPDPPPIDRLSTATGMESYGGKTIQLRTGALSAYRAMIAEARKAVPGLADDPDMLRIFSAYRSPEYDAERCAREQNCQGITRAECSGHRTGLALDIVVGHAPGYDVDSSADPNRLAMSRTPAYRWLVINARRFGFANYPFEPWHWEWTGEAI
ncbi:hypothetical protein BH11PSE2_BH11PSE2_05340 [soil metagenome]